MSYLRIRISFVRVTPPPPKKSIDSDFAIETSFKDKIIFLKKKVQILRNFKRV